MGPETLDLIDGIEFEEVILPSNKYHVSAGKFKQIETIRKLVIPIVKVHGKQLSPSQLSDGTFKSMGLIFDLLIDSGKLILMEEPEVAVHHGLLSSIIDIIISESKNKQIVISTHSDSILDKLSPEQVILVSKDREIGTTAVSIKGKMSANDFRVLKGYLSESGTLGEYWKEGGFNE